MPRRMSSLILAVAVSAAATCAASAADPAPAAFTAADAVRPLTLPVGVTSTLRLPSNPSTGYAWQVVETVNLHVEEPIAIARAASGEPVVGAPGEAVIRITPRGKGPASLTLTYKRPWAEAGADDQTLTFVFDARPAD